jgi:hypothetical protein
MQPFFSNARSKAGENHINLSDTRRATLAARAHLIMRARHDLLVAAGGGWRAPGATGFCAAPPYPRCGKSTPPQIRLKQALSRATPVPKTPTQLIEISDTLKENQVPCDKPGLFAWIEGHMERQEP